MKKNSDMSAVRFARFILWLIGLGFLLLIFSVIAFGMGSCTAADVIKLPGAPNGLRISLE
jgi:hypothetical protein